MLPDQIAKSDSEHAHQTAFFQWLNFARITSFDGAWDVCMGKASVSRPGTNPEGEMPELALAHAIPNGGKRDAVTASKLKAEGVKPGVPDTFLPIPMPRRHDVPTNMMYHGLYIEFKKPSQKPKREGSKGGVSDAQMKFMEQALHLGYACHVAYSWREAANIVMAYYGSKIRFET